MQHDAGLTWLHISDVHFQPKKDWRDIPARRSLLAFLRKQFADKKLPTPDLIFCTGDIAFGESAKATITQQYGYANDFFTELLQLCGSLPKDRLFVVPGNHDVNRTKVNQDAQSALGNKSKESRTHEEAINQRFESAGLEHQQTLQRLADYGLFIQERLPHQSNPERHVYAKVFDIRGTKIGVGGFNSAWSCAGPEDNRHLWLAAQWQFNHVQQLLEPAQLRIGLIHHPVDWLNEAERDVSTRRIAGNFHFWLHGHMHNAWVSPGPTCTTVAAGAVGAAAPDEFGINLVSLDFAKNSGKIHLFGYSARDDGWTSKPVAHHAPDGVWPLSIPTLPELIAAPKISCAKLPETAPATENSETEAVTLAEHALPTKRPQKLYGREKLIVELLEQSKSKNVLVLYGLRGNGKTELINALLLQQRFVVQTLPLRITVHPEYGVNSFFRQLAPALGDTAEQPRLPGGSRDEMVAALRQKYPNAAPCNIWIDKAHLWINAHGWLNPELERLFHACCIAFSDRFFWFFELRERPIKPGLFGSTSYEKEVPGLDKTSLGECLKDAAPTSQQAAWTYSGDRLKQLYQWLGGGHGNQAHPLAIQLLIEVARGRQRTPLDALQQLPREAEQRIEEALLGDLYAEVLSPSEQTLLQALALYREPIPHDHADELEQRLEVPQAWDGLYRRCLLPSDGGQAYFYLHGFIASWVRHQLGYESDDDTLTPVRSNIDRSAFNAARLQQLHEVVAACWLKQLGNTKRITQVNIERALEAFHHLLCAGQADGIQNIAIELLGTNLEWVHQRLWQYDEDLRARNAPIAEQRNVLEYVTQLDPQDHKAWRFLGECWGQHSSKALDCFRIAHELNPGFPQYLANLGKALIRQGAAGAKEFLDRLNTVRQQHPEAINEYVIAVQADALAIADSGPAASALRQAQITQGDRHPAFYSAEAEYRLSLGEHAEANRFLDLAKQRGCADAYTESIRAKVLEAQGDGPAASALRQAQITQGDRHPAFYAAEAEYQLSLGKHAETNRFLDLAKQRGCANAYTESIRAKLLEAQGDGPAASALRQAQITQGDRHPAFYNAEAEYQLSLGKHAEANRFLDLAKQRGCADAYTESIRAKLLEAQGDGPAASALRQAQITQGDHHPVFYAAEAEYQLSLGKHAEANRFLDLAKQRGCANAYTESIRAKLLEAQGDGPAASALRQAQITQGDRHPVFYAAEAEYQLSLGEHAEANRFLDLAKQRGCADAYTESIRAKLQRVIKQMPGDQHEAASLKGKPLVYISYAWGGDSDRAVDGLQAQLASSADLRRDRTTMQPGDSIRTFEQEIGRGACVVVVLSAKYMRSPDCMRELGFLWERSQRDGATFSQRVIPVVLDDAQIGSQADRIAHVKAWQEEKVRLEALVKELGPALCGQSTTQALQDIHTFQAQLVDALTWLADQVMPRGFAALDAANYAPVIDLIKRRLG